MVVPSHLRTTAMASAQMPDEFFDAVAHHLQPERPVGPKGGRPRVDHRTALRVIWFVLTAGTRWEDVPKELGCSGRTAHRRLRAWEEAGIWDRLHADLLRLLKEADKLDTDTVIIDGVTVRAFGGGEATGPSPVDRSRPGTKHTLMVDPSGVPLAIRTAGAPGGPLGGGGAPGPSPVDRSRRGTKHTLMVDPSGVPLAIRTAGANASDHRQVLPLVLDFPKVGGKPGRPKELPDDLYADRG